MRDRTDDEDTYNSTFQEDHEELQNVHRELGSQYQATDFIKEKYLGDGDHCDDELRHICSTGS